MASELDFTRMLPAELLSGRCWTSASELPVSLYAILGDLRPRFLPKCQVGKGYRAIARNGRVLLASDVPISELENRLVKVRLQVWNRAILSGDRPEPYGVLLHVRGVEKPVTGVLYDARIISGKESNPAIALDVGGGSVLAFEPNERK